MVMTSERVYAWLKRVSDQHYKGQFTATVNNKWYILFEKITSTHIYYKRFCCRCGVASITTIRSFEEISRGIPDTNDKIEFLRYVVVNLEMHAEKMYGDLHDVVTRN